MASLQETTDEQKRQILAAGAQGGDAAAKAFTDAQAAIRAQQSDALTEAGRQAALIGATGANNAVNALVSRPAAQLQDVMQGDAARFAGARGLEQQGSLDYLTKLGSLGPQIDAIAAARASGGGGGGGGGGSTKKEPELSDSELRVRLTGAATQQREEQVQAAAQTLAGDKKPKQATKQQIKQVNQQLRKANKNDAPQHRIKQLRAQRTQLHNALTLEKQGLRKDYAGAASTIRSSVAPRAVSLGIDAGVDEDRARGLFGPSQTQSLDVADAKQLKSQGGVGALLGRVPRATRFDVAKQMKVKPEVIHQIRSSSIYSAGARTLQQRLADGADLTQEAALMRAAMNTTDPKTGKKLKKPQRAFPDQVLNVLLQDYAPAFAK